MVGNFSLGSGTAWRSVPLRGDQFGSRSTSQSHGVGSDTGPKFRAKDGILLERRGEGGQAPGWGGLKRCTSTVRLQGGGAQRLQWRDDRYDGRRVRFLGSGIGSGCLHGVAACQYQNNLDPLTLPLVSKRPKIFRSGGQNNPWFRILPSLEPQCR